MIEYNHIIVWDCTFSKTDDDGNMLLNEDNTVKQFAAPKFDWSDLSEYVEHDDLEEV